MNLNLSNELGSIDVETKQEPTYTVPESRFKGLTIGDAMARSFQNESLAYSLYKGASDLFDDEATDINFNDNAKEKMFNEFGSGINPMFKDYILRTSKNENQMKSKIAEFEKESITQEYLDSLGMTGVMMNIGSGLTDLALILPTIATAEITAPAVALALGSTATRRAILGGVAGGATELVKDFAGEKEITAIDYGISIAVGSAANAAFKYDPILHKTSLRALDRLKASSSRDIPTYKAAMDDLAKRTKEGSFSEDTFNLLRKDLAFLTQTSKSGTFSKLGDELFIDPTLQTNKAGFKSHMEYSQEIEELIVDNYLNEFNPVVKEFAKDVYGQNWANSRFGNAGDIISGIAGNVQMQRNLYDLSDTEALSLLKNDLIESGASIEQADKFSKSILSGLNNSNKRIYDILKSYGKKGFKDGEIEFNPKYMTIQYNQNMANTLADKGLKYNDFNKFIKDSMISNIVKKTETKEIGEELMNQIDEASNTLASAIWKNEEAYKNGSTFNDMFRSLDFMLQNKQAGKDNFFTQFRSPLDYGYKQKIMTANGEVELSFMDLVNKNYFGVQNMYSRKMGGSVALERMVVKSTKINEEKITALRNSLNDLRNQFSTRLRDIQSGKQTVESIAKEIGYEDIGKAVEYLKTLDEKGLAQVAEDAKIIRAKKQLEEVFGSDIVKELEQNALAKGEKYKEFARNIMKNIESNQIPLEKQQEYFTEQFEPMRKQFYQDLEDSGILKRYEELASEQEDLVPDTLQGAEAIRKKIDTELQEAGVTPRQRQAELVRYDELINELRGNPTSSDPFGTATQVERIVKNMNIARLLGQTGITMTAELGNAIYHTGLKNFMEFSSMKSIINQLKTGKLDDTLAQEIQTHMGLGTGLNRAIGVNAYEHEFNLAGKSAAHKMDRWLDKAEGLSEKFSEATLMLGGVKPLTAWMEVTIAKDTISRLSSVFSGSLDKRMIADLNEFGVDIGMVRKIQTQIKKHGKKEAKKWSNGKKVVELGFDSWTDEDAKHALVTATRRITNTIIQKSYTGDKLGITAGNKLVRNGLFGKLALQLKDYMITSYTKQLGRALGRSDAYVAGQMMTQIAMLSSATLMQNYMNFYGNEDKLEKSLEPANFARNVMGKMTISSYIPMVTDTALKTFTGEAVFSPSRYNSPAQDAIMSLPSLDLAIKSGRLLSAPFRTAWNQEIDPNDINALFGVVPLGNFYGVRTAKESILDDLK